MTAFFFVVRSVKFISLPWRAEISVNHIATLYTSLFRSSPKGNYHR